MQAFTQNTEINWRLSGNAANGDTIKHCARCDQQQHKKIQAFINAAIDRSIGIIPQSMHDDARYLLFNWHSADALLTIVTTDDHKQHDATECVQLCIQPWQQQSGDFTAQHSDDIHFWIRDYLTTCPEFLHYALIAVFCTGDRLQSRLL